jgi:hypothetical protein
MASLPSQSSKVAAIQPRYFPPPLLHILLLVLILIDPIPAAVTQCYDASGAVKSIDGPCDPTAEVSICCGENWGE